MGTPARRHHDRPSQLAQTAVPAASARARTPVLGFALTLACLLAAGCASHVDRLREPRQLFLSGDLAGADRSLVQQLERRRSRDHDALALDLAIVRLCEGNPREAEDILRDVRDRFDYLQQASAGESLLAVVTDDQRQAYSGESYEKVLVRVFLALCNLMRDGGDVESYTLQIDSQQAQLARQASETEPAETTAVVDAPLAIGPYLRGVLKEATHRDYDDAARAFQQVVHLAPEFSAGVIDAERASFGRHSAPGNGVLLVFGLVDRGPIKVEQMAEATSDALLIADRILSAVGPHELPPTIAPVKIPVVSVPPPRISHLQVEVNQHPACVTETICDIGDLALRHDHEMRSHHIARAVARRVAKKSAVFVAKDQLEISSPWTDLAMTAAGVAWEATESADTRCWGLLPRAIQVRRCELPAGRHTVRIRPVSVDGQPGPAVPVTIDVLDGRNTYLLGYFPGPSPRPVGELMVSVP